MNAGIASDFYALIGVPRDATELEIRRAYGRYALRVSNESSPEATRLMVLLNEALGVLTDPERRALYDAGLSETEPVGEDAAPVEADRVQELFRHACVGGLWFAGGGLVTAVSYAATPPGGTYLIAWGAVLFGSLQLLGGLLAYRHVPSQLRTAGQLVTLAGLMGIGILSAGWVVATEAQALREDPAISQWNDAIDRAAEWIGPGDVLFNKVGDRTGAWNATDSGDMREVASRYSLAAEAVAAVAAPAGFDWYRDGLVRNFREAADIALQLSRLNEASSQSSFDTLIQRWTARLSDFQQLEDRFGAQNR